MKQKYRFPGKVFPVWLENEINMLATFFHSLRTHVIATNSGSKWIINIKY